MSINAKTKMVVLLRFLKINPRNICFACTAFDALVGLTRSDKVAQVRKAAVKIPLHRTSLPQSVSISGWPSSHAIIPHGSFYQSIDNLDLSTSEPIQPAVWPLHTVCESAMGEIILEYLFGLSGRR